MNEQHKTEIQKRLNKQSQELKFDPTQVYTDQYAETVDYDVWLNMAVLGDEDIVEIYFKEQGINLDDIALEDYRDLQNDMMSDLINNQGVSIDKLFEIPELKLDLSKSDPSRNIQGKSIEIDIVIDNNRYGSGYKEHARYRFQINNFTGSKVKLYHHLAENYVLKIEEWKNADIKGYSNYGSHGTDEMAINFDRFNINN